MQSLNNLVFLAIQAIFLYLEEGSWATCEIFSLTVLIIRYHSLCFTIRYVNALCRHLSKELYSFYLAQPAAVKSFTIT